MRVVVGLAIAGVLLVGVFFLAAEADVAPAVGDGAPKTETGSAPGVTWTGDLAAARRRAGVDDRLLLLYVAPQADT